MNCNLALSVSRHGIRAPEAVAIATEAEQLGYGALAHRASRIAEVLLHGHGSRQRSKAQPRVALLVSRSIEAYVGLVGTCWAGMTYVPIGPRQPESRILSTLAQSMPAVLIVDDESASRLTDEVCRACPPLVIGPARHASRMPGGDGRRYVAWESLPDGTGVPIAEVAAEDTAYVIFTSGTTGQPKGVVIRAGAARHYIATAAATLGIRSSDRVLESCDLAFDFSVHDCFSAWEAGAAVHVLPAARAMNAVSFARDRRLTVWNSVPSLVAMLAQVKALKDGSLPDLRLTVFGGEPLPRSVVAAWRRAAPNTAIINLYGPTEATVFCLGQSVVDQTALSPGLDFLAIGKPLPGSEATVLDAGNLPVADGMPGQLALSGAQLSSGYLGDADLTASRFPILEGKRWFLTGDRALRDKSGCFLYLGRIDNQVKVSGYRVELEEVDAHLRAASGAPLVCTVPWPVADGMARGLVGFVATPPIDPHTVLAALRQRLPEYMVPRRLVVLDAMPVNQAGKPDRLALQAVLREQDPTGAG